MNFRKILLAGSALALTVASATAQVNVVPQVGVTTGYLAKNTFSSSFYGVTLANAAALNGSIVWTEE